MRSCELVLTRVALAGILLLGETGCGASRVVGAGESEPQAAEVAQAAQPKGRIEAMPDLESLLARLKALEGRVVLVDFWATWCPPCRVSLPYYSRWQTELGPQGLTILAINVDEPSVKLEGFLARLAPDLLVIRDPEMKAAAAFEVQGMPTAFLIDRDGQGVDRLVGFSAEHAASVRAQIEEVLARP